MFRKLKTEECKLILKLVGVKFSYKHILLNQVTDAEIANIFNSIVYEIKVKCKSIIPVSKSLLGEGTFKDLDGTPVVVSLLQKNGLLWRLDINKLNSEAIMCFPDIENIRCLGFGQGVSFED